LCFILFKMKKVVSKKNIWLKRCSIIFKMGKQSCFFFKNNKKSMETLTKQMRSTIVFVRFWIYEHMHNNWLNVMYVEVWFTDFLNIFVMKKIKKIVSFLSFIIKITRTNIFLTRNHFSILIFCLIIIKIGLTNIFHKKIFKQSKHTQTHTYWLIFFILFINKETVVHYEFFGWHIRR